jgi:hypothetical protein
LPQAFSQRWTHLWKFTDGINFSGIITVNNIESNYSLNESIYSILVSRDAAGSHFIDSFSLEIEYGSYDLALRFGIHNVNKWINFIVQRKLKHLRLHVSVNSLDDDDDDDDDDEYGIPKLPVGILTCTTLVSLDLGWFLVKPFDSSSIRFGFGFGFGFPSLNVLHLDNVIFDELQDFLLLLAGCPNLEHLRVVGIYFHDEEVDPLFIQEFKSFSLPKLISAHITHCCLSSYFPLKALSNLKSLRIDTFMFRTKDHKFFQVRFIYLFIEYHALLPQSI